MMMDAFNVCVVGGTGRVGSGLATRLKEAGYNVALGSRFPQQHKCQSLCTQLGVEAKSNHQAAADSNVLLLW